MSISIFHEIRMDAKTLEWIDAKGGPPVVVDGLQPSGGLKRFQIIYGAGFDASSHP